ncbi:MAG: hypothetical protein V4501_12210 [Pseudomonadota bacterium]
MANPVFDKMVKRAKAIRKAHPKKKWQDCLKEAGAEVRKVGGVKAKKKTVGKTKTAAPASRKKSVTGVKAAVKPVRAAVKKVVKVAGVKPKKSTISGVYGKGLQHIRNINKLEADRKNAKGSEARRFIQIAINAEHKKLTKAGQQLKS